MNTIDEKIQIDLDLEIEAYRKGDKLLNQLITKTAIDHQLEIQSKRVSRIETLTRLLE